MSGAEAAPRRTFMEAALAGGWSYRQVGDAYGISSDAARMRARRRGLRSLLPGRPPRPETARRVEVARQMRGEGHDDCLIGERLGLSADAVRMMRLRAGVS